MANLATKCHCCFKRQCSKWIQLRPMRQKLVFDAHPTKLCPRIWPGVAYISRKRGDKPAMLIMHMDSINLCTEQLAQGDNKIFLTSEPDSGSKLTGVMKVPHLEIKRSWSACEASVHKVTSVV